MSDSTASPRKGITRRTLVKGAAWSVPVVAVASSVPAYAKSGGPPKITIGLACKQPGASCDAVIGSKGYTFAVTITNTTDKDVWIYTGMTQATAPVADPTLFTPVFNVTYSNPPRTFTYERARLVTFLPDGTPVIGDYISDPNESLLIPKNGGSVTIIVSAGVNQNSAQLEIEGYLYFAWGHEPVAGADPDHPFTPKPTSEGWTGGDFYFPDFTSCNDAKFYDCVPFLK